MIEDCSTVDVTEMPGPDLLQPDEDIKQTQALSCRNVEYVEGQVRIPRRGFTRVWDPASAIRLMYNWIQQQYDKLIYLNESNNLISRDLSSGSEVTIPQILENAAGGTFAQAGFRLYLSFFTAAGEASVNGTVWDGTNLEIIFHPPPTFNLAGTSPAADIKAATNPSFIWANVTNLGAGAVTNGQHYIALVATTLAGGYQTAPGPSNPNASVVQFAPDQLFSGTVPAGNYHISVSVSPQSTWPPWIYSLQIAMTPATFAAANIQLLRYFLIPGQIVKPTPGSTTPAVFDLNIDDVTLLGGGPTEITNTLFGLIQATQGNGFATVSGGGLVSITVASNVGTIKFSSDATYLMVGQKIVVSNSTTGALNGSYIITQFTTFTDLTITTVGVPDGVYNNAPLRVDFVVFGSGNNNYRPHCVIAYGNRTVYLIRTLGPDNISQVGGILVSEPNKPQYVTANNHLLLLPEARDVVTAFALGGTLFVLGPSWTYAFSDNLRVPVFWAPPRLVSESIGSPFIRGVSVNQSKGYGWVGDHTGLYCFSGSNYPVVPASYKQKPDWDRINFGASQASFRVLDSPDERLVIVRAALDGATASTHLLVWDYTYGVTPDKIRYCGLWNLTADPNIGDIEIVQNATSKIKQLYLSSGTAGGDVKRIKAIEAGDANDAYPNPLYDDDGAGIDAAYELCAVAKAADGPQMQIGGRFRIRGAGQVGINAHSFDQQRTTVLEPISAAVNSLAPGQRFDRFFDEQSEVMSYEVHNNAQPGVFAWWTALRAYFVPWFGERGEDQ